MMIDRPCLAARVLLAFIIVLLSCGLASAAKPGASKSAPAKTVPTATPAPPAPAPAENIETNAPRTGATFAIADPPSWVKPYPVEAASMPSEAGDGISYLLIDQQQNLEPFAFFYHEAHLITSDTGVQNGAAISTSFDPSYNKLTFHYIRIHRAGQVLDRLDRSQIRLLQREPEAESFLYDGAFTAQCQLEDVRIGDIVEYAYTVTGANPVSRGHYYDTFVTQWSAPVHRAIVRLLRPAAHPLHILTKNRTINPVISTDHGITEWLWDETNIPVHRGEPNTPRGYTSFGFVQFTDFAKWQEVVDWAVPLYQVTTPSSPELDEEIAKLRAMPNEQERILAALRFVQEDIRYLGIESGIGSHQPTAPSEVLRRRFGDCKDKTLLLATILRQCGLQATPALVSSFRHHYLAERLPSPSLFNHVILRVENGHDGWWLDATRNAQRGPLSQIYVSDFAYALLLREGTQELTPCGPQPTALPKHKITDTYHINKPGSDSRLDVVTESHGLSADYTRGYFQSHTHEEIEKSYLQYYARSFPRVRVAESISYEELPGENACRVHEHYIIPDIWQLTEDKRSYRIHLEPSEVQNALGHPRGTERAEPLAVAFPEDIVQEMNAEFFQNWTVKPVQRDISNDFFHYHHDSNGSGRHVQLNYSYHSLTDSVPVASLATYDTALRQIRDKLGYNFTYTPPAAVNPNATNDPQELARETQLNWPMALFTGMIVIAALVCGILFYQKSWREVPLPPPLTHQNLDGIGGWLICVMLGLIFRPFAFFAANIRILPLIFHLGPWQRLTVIGQSGYHPMWMPVLLFEFFYNLLMGLYSILILILFFQKRAVWPRTFVVLLAAMPIAAVLDHLLASQIPTAAGQTELFAKNLSQTVFPAMIWIPYAFVSERVKATFRY